MTTHVLKTDRVPFAAVWRSEKRCEIRKNDRGFAVGDTLKLCERVAGVETGRAVFVVVTHIQDGYGLPEDIVALSVEEIYRVKDW